MTREEMFEKYLVLDDEIYRPKDGYVIQLDLFTVDYVSFIEGDMIYSMASDNKYSLHDINMDCIKVFKSIVNTMKKQYQKVADTALDCLPDLRTYIHLLLDGYQDGRITRKEYMERMVHYKNLRDALYHAGHLPDDWDDMHI